MELFDLYREDRWPLFTCPGCGIGTVMNCFYRAFASVDLDIDKTVFVSGIGCSSRVPGYVYGDSLHTTHGRPIAFASGVKLAKPELSVIVFTGDGDLGAIGGNHFINGCRRNMDLLVICINNNIYGMTGGQASTATPHGFKTATTPRGTIEYPFDLSRLAAAAGANYVARWTTYHVKQLTRAIKDALGKRGMRFVEVVAQCPTYFGRFNKMPEPPALLKWLQENSVPLGRVDTVKEVDPLDLHLDGKITVGTFRDAQRSSYLEMVGRDEDTRN